jgi:hypothetical protein
MLGGEFKFFEISGLNLGHKWKAACYEAKGSLKISDEVQLGRSEIRVSETGVDLYINGHLM